LTIDVDRENERVHLENVISGKAKPTLSPPATLGRLAELYLETPQSPGLAEKAFQLTQAALKLVTAESPLYPKLLHFHAIAMRWKAIASKDLLSVLTVAAKIDREVWNLSYDKAPQEALLFANEWADWAWEQELWDEASEAYALSHRALRRVALHQIDEFDRFKLLEHFRLATRGAYALAKLGNSKDAIVLLERASDLLFIGGIEKRDLMQLAQSHPDLHDRLIAAQVALARARDEHGLTLSGRSLPKNSLHRLKRMASFSRSARLTDSPPSPCPAAGMMCRKQHPRFLFSTSFRLRKDLSVSSSGSSAAKKQIFRPCIFRRRLQIL
jgi:hypothetical protein